MLCYIIDKKINRKDQEKKDENKLNEHLDRRFTNATNKKILNSQQRSY